MNKMNFWIAFGLWFVAAGCSQNDMSPKVFYITTTGNKYHLSKCHYLGKSCVPITLKETLERGYEPCSDCFDSVNKDSSDQIEISHSSKN